MSLYDLLQSSGELLHAVALALAACAPIDAVGARSADAVEDGLRSLRGSSSACGNATEEKGIDKAPAPNAKFLLNNMLCL